MRPYTPRPGEQGERHHKAKLTNAQAAQIRERLRAGERCGPLAREFGLSHKTVWQIKHGVTYRYVGAAKVTLCASVDGALAGTLGGRKDD
jgi:hypothetical protein